MVMAVAVAEADTVVGHTIIIQDMVNIMGAAVAGFQIHLRRAPAFMDGTLT